MIHGLKEEVAALLNEEGAITRANALSTFLLRFSVPQLLRMRTALRFSRDHWLRLWIDPVRCIARGEEPFADDCMLCHNSMAEGKDASPGKAAYQIDHCYWCPLTGATTSWDCSSPSSPWTKTCATGDGRSFLQSIYRAMTRQSKNKGEHDGSRTIYDLMEYTTTPVEFATWRSNALRMAAVLSWLHGYLDATLKRDYGVTD